MFVNERETNSVRRLAEAIRRNPRDTESRQAFNRLAESVRRGEIDRRDLSLRNAFVSLVEGGSELIHGFDPRRGGSRTMLREAGVHTGLFANISGQIVYSEVMDAYQNPQFIGPRLARTVPTQFDGEKIPGITAIGDVAESIGEGKAYPIAGVSESWIETPSTIKRGLIIPITKEAIFFDRTGQLLDRCRRVAEAIAINKEKRLIDLAVGATSAYRRNGSALIATYGDNSGTHNWDNLAASNTLVDWTDIDVARQLFDGITDPDTGEPIILDPNQLLVPTSLTQTAAYILNATEVRTLTASSTITTIGPSPNPYPKLEVLYNQWVTARLTAGSIATTTWYIGDFMRAFAYMENWPITTSEAPSNSHEEFHYDIVQQFKVSERGAAAVVEPRAVVKCTAA